ncbi:MAG: hypothetical protein Kow00109_21640 [Acidobacteriota bacterium]
MWLAVFASLGFVLLDVLRRILGRRLPTWQVVVGINAGAGTLLLPVLFYEGIPAFDYWFVGLASLEAVNFAVTSFLYVQAVRLSPLSLTVPYLSFTPLVSAVAAWLILGEVPPFRGWVGISLLLAGGILLHGGEGRGWLRLCLAPLREPGTRRMLIVAAVWGVTTSVDKLAIQHGSEALLGAWMSLGGALLILLFRPRLGDEGQSSESSGSAGLLLAAAAVAGAAVLAQFYAYRTTLVAYVEAVKRAGGFVSALLGVVAFGEGRFRHRIPAAALMLAGVLLIVL